MKGDAASGLACAARWGRSGRGVGVGRVLGAGREAEAALLGCGAAQGEEGVAAEQRLGRGVDARAERAECWAGRAGKTGPAG